MIPILDIPEENFILLCRLLVVGPVLKWLALFMYVCMYFSVFTPLTRPLYISVPTTCSRPSIEMVGFITVPTTCSRPSIEMVGFIFSPCSLSWPGRFTLRGRTWPKGVKNYCRRTPRV